MRIMDLEFISHDLLADTLNDLLFPSIENAQLLTPEIGDTVFKFFLRRVLTLSENENIEATWNRAKLAIKILERAPATLKIGADLAQAALSIIYIILSQVATSDEGRLPDMVKLVVDIIQREPRCFEQWLPQGLPIMETCFFYEKRDAKQLQLSLNIPKAIIEKDVGLQPTAQLLVSVLQKCMILRNLVEVSLSAFGMLQSICTKVVFSKEYKNSLLEWLRDVSSTSDSIFGDLAVEVALNVILKDNETIGSLEVLLIWLEDFQKRQLRFWDSVAFCKAFSCLYELVKSELEQVGWTPSELSLLKIRAAQCFKYHKRVYTTHDPEWGFHAGRRLAILFEFCQ